MLLHALIVMTVPNFNFPNKLKQQQLIQVELLKPAPLLPTPVIEPLPTTNIPKPPKPKPVKKAPKPVTKPKPVEKKAPIPVKTPAEVPPVEQEIIAAQPTVESIAEILAPTPTEPAEAEQTPETIKPPPPPQPNQADRDQALNAYSSRLGRAIAKYKSYPKLAQRRGWQGTVLLDIKVDSQGNVLSAVVNQSSGHSALDKRALKMVEKASPFPAPPIILKGESLNISVPVIFKLANT